MGRFFHDGARQQNRIAYGPDTGRRTGAQAVAVHDRGIQFIVTVMGEHGALAGVEVRVVFQHRDRCGHRVERGLAGLQFGVAALDRLEQGGARRGLDRGRQAGTNDTGPAVDDQHRLL